MHCCLLLKAHGPAVTSTQAKVAALVGKAPSHLLHTGWLSRTHCPSSSLVPEARHQVTLPCPTGPVSLPGDLPTAPLGWAHVVLRVWQLGTEAALSWLNEEVAEDRPASVLPTGGETLHPATSRHQGLSITCLRSRAAQSQCPCSAQTSLTLLGRTTPGPTESGLIPKPSSTTTILITAMFSAYNNH